MLDVLLVERDGDTRRKLIETAERLFAERGLHGVSMREVGAAAGQRNHGVVRYHFGSKSALIDAVVLHRLEPINEERLALIEQLDREGRGFEMRGLTEALVVPLSRALGDIGHPTWKMRFGLLAGFEEGSLQVTFGKHPASESLHELRKRFGVALSDATIPERLHEDRWVLYTSHVGHAFADREHLLQHRPQHVRTSRAVFLCHVIDTACAIALAPASSELNKLLRTRRSA